MDQADASPARLRLFIAIELPATWHDAMAGQQAALRTRLGAAGQALRWVRRESFHITLVFLGDTPTGGEPRIRAAMTDAALAVAPFTVRLGAPGSFGGLRPRVVWAGVEGDLDQLSRLHRRLLDALAIGGREAARFSPHVTIARMPERSRTSAAGTRDLGAALAAALARVPAIEAPAMHVQAVSLMQSDLRPGGAVYSCRFSSPLLSV